jgi:hypothetical protein
LASRTSFWCVNHTAFLDQMQVLKSTAYVGSNDQKQTRNVPTRSYAFYPCVHGISVYKDVAVPRTDLTIPCGMSSMPFPFSVYLFFSICIHFLCYISHFSTTTTAAGKLQPLMGSHSAKPARLPPLSSITTSLPDTSTFSSPHAKRPPSDPLMASTKATRTHRQPERRRKLSTDELYM